MITKNYIKMCEKAKEVQRECHFYKGDWFFCQGDYFEVLDDGLDSYHTINLFKRDKFWLPTQEQLQKMVKTVLEVDDFGLVEEFYNFIYGEESQPNQIDSPIKSMEQFWLTFVMHELYNKLWIDEKWVKAE